MILFMLFYYRSAGLVEKEIIKRKKDIEEEEEKITIDMKKYWMEPVCRTSIQTIKSENSSSNVAFYHLFVFYFLKVVVGSERR